MALIEKTPGLAPEGQTHTTTALDSWDFPEKAFTLSERWFVWHGVCDHYCVFVCSQARTDVCNMQSIMTRSACLNSDKRDFSINIIYKEL